MSDTVDILVRAADAGATYLSWWWLAGERKPQYEVLSVESIESVLSEFDAALAAATCGDPNMLAGSPFADADREFELAKRLTAAVLPDRLCTEIRDRFEAGLHLRLRLTPSPRLARVPWELLCVADRRRLLEYVDLVLEPPTAIHAERSRLPLPWSEVRELAPLLLIDPVVPLRSARLHHLGHVLGPTELEAFASRVDDYVERGRLDYEESDTTLQPALDRFELSRALREPRSRLFYVGHVTSSPDEPGSAAIHLNDTADEWGLAAPLMTAGPDGIARAQSEDHRPLAALDLLMGTGSADRKVWQQYGFDEARPGHEVWPMPARVALIACEGGADYRATETFGLVIAIANAGAELVTTTRWTLPADRLLASIGGDRDIGPTSELALRVDAAHEGDDPIEELAQWQRNQLRHWQTTSDISYTPLVWAALAHTIAPARSTAAVRR